GAGGSSPSPAGRERLHGASGPRRRLPGGRPAGRDLPVATWTAYRAESEFISPDGRTVVFGASLAAGDADSNAAMHQVPAIRAALAGVARAAGATAYGVAGDAPALYDVSRASDTHLLPIFPLPIAAPPLLPAL